MDPYSTQLLMMNQIQQLSGTFVDHIRSILFALAFIVLGLICAEVAKYLSQLLLRWLRWERLSARLGLTALLQRYRADWAPVAAAAEAVFWFTFLTFGMKALIISGLPLLAAWGQIYFDLLPAAGKAAVVLLAGWWLAGLLGRMVLRLSEHARAVLVSELMRILILGTSGYYALLTLGVDADFVRPLVLIVCAGAVLAQAWPGARSSAYRETVRVK
ncbi:MAG: hypothetical protein AB1439_06835 [candidate division FCPU426 bacterium]